MPPTPMRIDFDLRTVALFIALFFPIAAFLYWHKKMEFVRIIFLWIFYACIVSIFSRTMLPFYFDESIRQIVGQNVWSQINIIPFVLMGTEVLKTSLLNILLFIPFGFLLPFVRKTRFREAFVAGLLLSISIEIFQFLSAFISGFTFRYIDINDILFNVLGASIGFGLFRLFARLFRKAVEKDLLEHNALFAYLQKKMS
jgi:glycopeptide antibiotics resistance protein